MSWVALVFDLGTTTDLWTHSIGFVLTRIGAVVHIDGGPEAMENMSEGNGLVNIPSA